MVSKKDVKHIAELSKLEFSDKELTYFTEEFSNIVEYVGELKGIDIDEVEPTYNISSKIQPLREDNIKPSLPREEVLKNAPEEQYGYFRLPRVMD
ncbi:Asp-tRNA(Asn)/Glu-tRNA(Gln) amidotransferase subunit GatC [Schnuerera sp. xch1]|uniref:Asp-tRNA(Asn)/Glu-tRNA(Gln) amidotransferase subunit GatC n=1 Tax=Schnuerera sp. xch1 TaxID=2874283 RepID=UPI001CBD797B|nr:Asp-tRNA(Asn)/Glu-tRNA(Gln) amidotransferase subunit GatC [Schnuerera sp. xch1]MBZ2175482.1 Asp-tRNA(Asn)/Glu-tRNA(Gln) amidotransferase subunit GatC [Schnuerera sp. xch1]